MRKGSQSPHHPPAVEPHRILEAEAASVTLAHAHRLPAPQVLDGQWSTPGFMRRQAGLVGYRIG